MTTATLPTAPAVEIAVRKQSGLRSLPPDVLWLYTRGHCGLAEAARFLGLSVKANGEPGSTAYSRAERYRKRVDGVMFETLVVHGEEIRRPRPYELWQLYPRMKHGEWLEIPNTKAGIITVDSWLLVPMRYPAVPWPF